MRAGFIRGPQCCAKSPPVSWIRRFPGQPDRVNTSKTSRRCFEVFAGGCAVWACPSLNLDAAALTPESNDSIGTFGIISAWLRRSGGYPMRI
ncbi:hypothetical protein SCLCIDRAFT_30455 [Scleroderma citrinum Foug A]|uniref:Uncharacterized protein n=1 Tax=Scleroderma citrinum Foug A TaxID=1036808 RepID=A0A0C3DFZ3_9AGAM|nr:hypothetical protein SCLCIDRAFT_30455 [Scleroderma citrinum Foug A]